MSGIDTVWSDSADDTRPWLAAERVKPYHVEEWVNGYELSVTSRRNYFRAVRRCYRWGKKQGYISTNPVAELEVPRAEHREVAISQEEFDVLKSNIPNRCLADLVKFTWLTGCRPQELVIVEAVHVDIANQRLVFRVSQSKGKKVSRVVYVPDDAMEILRKAMAENPSGPLFRNTEGKPWTQDAINCAFGAVQTRMGKAEMKRRKLTVSDRDIAALIPKLKPARMVQGQMVDKTEAELRCEAKRKLTQKKVEQLAPRYSLYALRHSFATNALQKGIDSLTVAVLLGHKDPSTLARVYQHLNQNPAHLLQEARRAIA